MNSNLQSAGWPSLWLKQKPHFWMRFLLASGVLFLSAILPRIAVLKPYWPIILGLPFVLVGVTALMRWRSLGLILIVGSMMISYSGPSGLNATMVLVGLLFVLWLIDSLVRQRNMYLASSPVFRPLLYLNVVAILAFLAGQLPWYGASERAPVGAQLGGLSIYLLSALGFLLIVELVQGQRWLEWMVGLYLVLGALLIAALLLQSVSGLSLLRFFPSGMAGSMFWAWLAALAFGQALLNERLAWPWRLSLALLVLAVFYSGYFLNSDWKSGWIPPLVSVVTIIGMRSRRLALAMVLGGLVLVPGLAAKLIATDQYSYSTRIDAWLIVLEIVKVSPMLGLGPANYRWFTPLFPIRGFAVQFNSHNQYVDLVAQTGLLGLVCFLWFFWEVGLLAWRLRKQVPEGFARAYIYGALGGTASTLVGAMLGDWVLPFFYNVGLKGFRVSLLPWLFLGGVVALRKLGEQNEEVEV